MELEAENVKVDQRLLCLGSRVSAEEDFERLLRPGNRRGKGTGRYKRNRLWRDVIETRFAEPGFESITGVIRQSDGR